METKSKNYRNYIEKVNGEENLQMQSSDDTTFLLETQRKLRNSLYYWSKQFSSFVRETAIIFVPVKNYKITKISPVLILRKLIQLDMLKDLKGISMLTNKAYVYLRFSTEEVAVKFRHEVKFLEDFKMEYVDKLVTSDEIWGSIGGVPPINVIEFLQEKVEGIAKISDITPTLLKLPHGQIVDSAPTKFKITMEDDKKIDELPNFVFFGNFKAYINIEGRRQVCFNCDQNSHLSRNCPWIFCKKCKKMSTIEHKCTITYADKVKLSANNFQDMFDEAMSSVFKSNLQDGNLLHEMSETDSQLDIDEVSYSEDSSADTLPYAQEGLQKEFSADELSENTGDGNIGDRKMPKDKLKALDKDRLETAVKTKKVKLLPNKKRKKKSNVLKKDIVEKMIKNKDKKVLEVSGQAVLITQGELVGNKDIGSDRSEKQLQSGSFEDPYT